MTVKVISKRAFQMDSKKIIIPFLAKLGSLSQGQPGHVFRETLRSLDNPGEFLTISEWDTIEDWNKWMKNEERREIQGRMDSLIGEKTHWEVFEIESF